MDKKLLTAAVFNNLRILHSITPGDTYIQNYLWHLRNWGDEFFDLYHLCFYLGSIKKPSKILEIGCRTGTSLIQLLTSYVNVDTPICIDLATSEMASPPNLKIILFDLFSDGLCTPSLIIKHLEHFGLPTEGLEFHTGNSHETVPQFKETNSDKFDWILVDGSHSPDDLRIDLENVVDLVAPGGVLVVDDIASLEAGKISRFGLPGAFNLRPVWFEFREKYYEQFNWFEDHTGKGVAWGIHI